MFGNWSLNKKHPQLCIAYSTSDSAWKCLLPSECISTFAFLAPPWRFSCCGLFSYNYHAKGSKGWFMVYNSEHLEFTDVYRWCQNLWEDLASFTQFLTMLCFLSWCICHDSQNLVWMDNHLKNPLKCIYLDLTIKWSGFSGEFWSTAEF